jgi:hypothetical protein
MKLPDYEEAEKLRENTVLTQQCDMPEWTSKLSWLALGRIRAFSQLQLHEILLVLKERIMYSIHEAGPFDALAAAWRVWITDISWPLQCIRTATQACEEELDAAINLRATALFIFSFEVRFYMKLIHQIMKRLLIIIMIGKFHKKLFIDIY